jgi:hypothetical protein
MSQAPGQGTASGPQPRLPDEEQPLKVDSARGIAVAAVLALIAGGLLLTDGVPAFFSVPAGAALALVIPGYALSRAFFIHGLLDRAEGTVLAVGLSLCVAILGGFLLNVLPEGMSTHAWAIYLASVSLAACAAAAVRRGVFVVQRHGQRRLPELPGERPAGAPAADVAAPVTAPEPAAGGLLRREVAMLGLAAVLVAGSFLIAQFGVTAQPHAGFTDLWLLPGSDGVTLGFNNHEGVPTTYRVVLSVNGKDVGTWSSDAIADGGTWQAQYPLRAGAATTSEVVVSLYRRADTTAYRQAHLTVGPELIGPLPTAAASP